MRKLKLVTVIGTRPEIIRLSSCLKLADLVFDHVLVHTDQNWDYNLNDIFFEDLQLRRPDHHLNVRGAHVGETIGNIISSTFTLFQACQPDALLILGDTNSALCAISAKRLKIPIFHMEAGNRCFDQNVPEEINRKIIDHISDINICYTEHSRRYLLAEGVIKQHVFVMGSPMAEVLLNARPQIAKSQILQTHHLEKNKYIVLSTHREENIDLPQNREKLINAIHALAAHFNMPVIFPTHPRTKLRLLLLNQDDDNKRAEKEKKQEVQRKERKIRQIDPLGFIDYVALQQSAYCVVSDSGTVNEEAAMLNFPAVLLRTSSERPEVLDKGNIVIGGIEAQHLIASIELVKKLQTLCPSPTPPIDYAPEMTSAKVVKLIQSYVPIVNQVIWNKETEEKEDKKDVVALK